MALLNGAADLPTDALSVFRRPEAAANSNPSSVLLDIAAYIRSATLSTAAHDTARTAWTLVAPVWLQRQRRIRLLEQMMKEVGKFPFKPPRLF